MSDDMRRQYPLAHRDGIVTFAFLVADGGRKLPVSCTCGWKGKRTKMFADDRPCPRCGLAVTLHDRELTTDDLVASGLFKVAPAPIHDGKEV